MLLYNIEKETMIEVISKSKISLYKSSEIIFYQNSTPLNLYLVLTGEVSFKKYSSIDLLTMIGSEANIIPSKRYSDIKYRNSKMSRQTLQTMRNSAFKNYEDINKKALICGDFFCEENLISKSPYDNCAVVEKNETYILSINLPVFNNYLKKNISKALENIKELLLTRFQYFKQVDNNMFKIYMGKITKIFPKTGEIICKENDLSDKLYLIYQGKFAVQKNSKNLGNIIFLNKGDIFGYESLINIKPKIETETKINIEINIERNKYEIVNQDNSSIILCFDIPFFDELTTWKISKNLLSYFKEQNDIIHNFEAIKSISSSIFEERYYHLAKKKRNKSLNENNCHNNHVKEKKYKLLFKKSANSKKNYTSLKISNKRKVNFLTNYVKVFPKNYFKTNFQKFKLKDNSHSTNKNKKLNYASLLFNNLNTKNYSIKSKRNEDIEKYITSPHKETEIQGNILIESKQKSSDDKKSSSSSLLSNYKGKSNNSNSTKSTLGKRPSVSNKISTFVSTPSTTQNKTRNKKSTLFQNFISFNKNMTRNKTKKKTKKNKIYFRNGNNECTKFDISKNIDKRNPLYIFSYINNGKFNLTLSKGGSIDKKPKGQIVSKYNFPFIYEVDDSEIIF